LREGKAGNLEGRRFDREIFALALPALGALAAEPTYVLVDTAIVGHLGTPQLAALAIAATLLSTSVTLFNFLTTGRRRGLRGCTGRGRSPPRAGSARRRCGSRWRWGWGCRS
jgi:hypothetical protein